MNERKEQHRAKFWEEFDPDAPGARADLARIRAGLGEPDASQQGLWRYYRVWVGDATYEYGAESWALSAEHYALTLFALHQQSQSQSMHRQHVRLGTALRQLRHQSPSPDAVDRRVRALVDSDDTVELYDHLRSLVPQLRGIGQGLDYTTLFWDFLGWNHPDKRFRICRAWAAQYSDWRPKGNTANGDDTAADD